MDVKQLLICGSLFYVFGCKIVFEKFGSKEKSRTFALPFEKRVADEAESSYEDCRMKIKFQKFSQKSLEV